jgi:hypothetical protein
VADKGWKSEFEDRIPLQDGRMLVTLLDAGEYITTLPKAEQQLDEWQAAIEALMLCSRGGHAMLARIGVMRALNRHVERVCASQVSGKPTQARGCHTDPSARAAKGDHLWTYRHRHVADAHAEEWKALSLLSQPDRPEAGFR